MMKMMMVCNPYEKTIDYLWFEESQGKYIHMTDMPDSFPELTNAKYSKDVTLQSRADEIVKIIDNLDPGDLGIEVHFIGTQDDFDDLNQAGNGLLFGDFQGVVSVFHGGGQRGEHDGADENLEYVVQFD